MGNDHYNSDNSHKHFLFQSTFPRGERLSEHSLNTQTEQFQSTFPRGERRRGFLMGYGFIEYFNPRSRVGNDLTYICHYLSTAYFNPRSRVGNDGKRDNQIQLQKNFNPRSRVGNDIARLRENVYLIPRGERPSRRGFQYPGSNFNPRSRVGNDCKFSQIFFVFLCNKYNFSTFYYPFSLFFSVIHVTFLIFVVRILPAFYVYF